MKAWIGRNWKNWTLFPLLMGLVTVYVYTYGCAPTPREGGEETADPAAGSVFGVDCAASFADRMTQTAITCAALPEAPQLYNGGNTSGRNSRFPVNATNFEHFAWKSFVALNWPAADAKINATFLYRGFPDLSQNVNASAPATRVWETWKEKRELFYYGNVTGKTPDPNPPPPRPWNHVYDYWNKEQLGQVDACKGSEDRVGDYLERTGHRPRFLLQASKVPGNSLDENVEVPSQGDVDVTGKIAKAQVFKQVGGAEHPVLYEVKLNYDYYNYVASEGLYNDAYKLGGQPSVPSAGRLGNAGNYAAFAGANVSVPDRGRRSVLGDRAEISFPYRCNDFKATYNSVSCSGESYNLTASVQYLQKPRQPNDTPFPTGTVQTKAAWINASAIDATAADYHLAEALVYRKTSDGGLCVDHGHFALLGLHVIQKTHQQGFYLYATWERNGVDALGLNFTNFYAPQGGTFTRDGTFPVKRDHAVLHPTTAVNKLYQTALAGSVWKNYRLIGTQFAPIDVNLFGPTCYRQDPPGEDCNVPKYNGTNGGPKGAPVVPGQPFYLANLVIETNFGLQNFQGLPPGGTSVVNGSAPPYNPTTGFTTGFNVTGPPLRPFPTHPTFVFDRALTNFGRGRNFGTGVQKTNPKDPHAYGGLFNMGGCMGCHAVAAAGGADFSFVLLQGQRGAKPDAIHGTPD